MGESERKEGDRAEKRLIALRMDEAAQELQEGQERRLSPIVSELRASSRAATEVRRRLSEFESHLEGRLLADSEARQEKIARELGGKLRGELNRSVKLVRLEAVQAESSLEGLRRQAALFADVRRRCQLPKQAH